MLQPAMRPYCKTASFRAVRHSSFSDIFIPARSSNIFHHRKIVCDANILSSSSHVGNCIQLRHVASALDLDCVFHTIF